MIVNAKKVESMAADPSNYHSEHVLPPGADLKIFQFRAPATIRGVLIDNDLLSVGWYTYHQTKKIITRGANGVLMDGLNIQGDGRPAIIVLAGRPEFAILLQMFDVVLRNLRNTSDAVPLGEP